MAEWLGWFRNRWFISDEKAHKVDHPTLRDDAAGLQRRHDIQYVNGTIDCNAYQIPAVFQDVIDAAKVKHSKKTNTPMTPDAYTGIRMRPLAHDT